LQLTKNYHKINIKLKATTL